MRRLRTEAAYSVIELVVVLSTIGLVLTLSFSSWRGYTAQRQLRYSAAAVAADLRQAQERAKEARVPYTVTFTASSSTYVIAGGTFREDAVLPGNVVTSSSGVVTFSPFGQPNADHTITVQNDKGTGTVTVTSMGGISYQAP